MRTYFKVLWGIFSRVLHLAPWVTFFPYYYWRKTIWQTASSWPQTSTTPCNRIHRLFLLARRTQGQNRKHVLLLQTSWHKQKRICFFTPHKMDFPLRTNRQNQGTKKKEKAALVFCIVCTKRRFVCQSHLAIKRLLLSNQSHMVRLGNKRTWDMHTILDYTPLINLFWLVICSLEYMRKHI